MARNEALYVVCYDVKRDTARARIARILEKHMVRVQRSVFEAHMGKRRAEALAALASQHLDPGDSLRLYAIGVHSLKRSKAFGPQPLPETHEFYLL